jgi:glycosyltransferase involved in cell wall biosynthesis
MNKISVLIPTYNVEDYIEESITSILNQTYKNIEVIVVDDCSTDNTYSILENIAFKDNRLKVYRNIENKKISYTLNKALKYSTGEYIARMDGDDVCSLDKLEIQMNYLINNKNIDLVGVSTISIDEEGREIGRTRLLGDFKLLKVISKFSTPVSHIWLTKREAYDNLNGYRSMDGVEDYDFLLRMITLGYKFSNISEYYGYKVRIRKGNSTSSIGAKQRKAFEYVRRLYKERIKNGKDSYSRENYNQFIKLSKSENDKYIESMELLNKAFIYRSDGNKKWVILAIKSAIKSKYQVKYLMRSTIVKSITKIYK